VSDAASEPVDVIAAYRSRKAERDAPILEKLLGGTDADTDPARDRLRRAVAELDAALAALESDPEPAPESVLDAARVARETRRRALIDAALGRTQTPAAETSSLSLDGGVRQTVERSETHAEMLARVLRSGEANVGANL
jgi:hypothetical protein